jgi:nucleoside-diphosphate-sugar epimerase
MIALVTGGTGFLGGALTRRLHGMGAQVTALGRNPHALACLETQHIPVLRADLADSRAIIDACRDQDIVFHCGALSAPWGKPQDFYNANVAGTENIVRGCEEHHVKRLVYVSTPSIYFGYKPRFNVREDADLPLIPANEYARTKRMAEAVVDNAFRRGLPVITIRPRAIFGPGDQALLPRLIERLQKADLRIIGSGHTLADLTYVENVVDALLLCALSPADSLGKKYNITNGEQVELWDIVKSIADALGFPVPQKHISYKLMDSLARVVEIIYSMLPGQPEPPFTRYSVGVLALGFTLDISEAEHDLGYRPQVSIQEGLEEVIKSWKETNA